MPDNATIYEYKDAEGKTRKGDPVELLRRLHSYCHGDYNEMVGRAKSELPAISIPAAEELAKACCQTFRLGEVWDDRKGEGVMECVWREALDGLLEYCEKKEMIAVDEATSSPPTASESSPSTPTPNADSTSTLIAS